MREGNLHLLFLVSYFQFVFLCLSASVVGVFCVETKLMTKVRGLALDALHDIWQRGGKPKAVLERLSQPLDGRDRAFLMELVYGVLRYRDTLDWVLKVFLRKPSGLGTGTTDNLRLAVYQILFTRVPEWAAVNEAVELEKKRGRPEVVNGVLRSLLRTIDSVRSQLEGMRAKATAEQISILTSHPEWLIKRWSKRFGEKEAMGLAEANNLIPPMTLRVNTLKAERQEMLERLSEKGMLAEPTPYSPDGIRLGEFHVFQDLPFKEYLIVQDEASQLVSYLLGPGPGERILDACAAPGGKTTHLAQLMRDSGEIAAVESEGRRIVQLEENVSRLGLQAVRIVHSDVRALSRANYCLERPGRCLFDRVLLDAPCSSLGVVRRNPDVKYRHSARDLGEFKAKQLELIRTVSGMLKSGGTMVYSVCSTEPEEGEEVVGEFLKEFPDFYMSEPDVPFLKRFMNDGFFRTYPHKHDMDGFFGVRLCKRA